MLVYLGMFTTLTSFLYVFAVFILFSNKIKIATRENKIYDNLLITNLFSIIFELILYFCKDAYGSSDIFNNIYLLVSKAFVSCVFLWITYLFYYTILLSKKSELSLESNKGSKSKKMNEKEKKYNIIRVLIVFIIMLLPVDFNGSYTFGLANNFGFSLIFVCLFCMIGIIIKKWSNLKKNKTIPILLLVVLFFASTIVQFLNPAILIFNMSLSFITFLMYHTIENPDVKMIRELELAKSQAEKANRAKTDFLSSMSHEIRTPLNAIVGFSECIIEDETLDQAKSDAKDIIMASQNLLEIVNGVLDISKIEANKMEVVEVNYNPKDIFNDLIKLVSTRIGDKDIKLRTDFALDLPENLHGDSGKVKEIITNILTNAVKYTEKGYIDFKVNCINEKNTCKLVISVSDTGRGIKPEKIESLFTKFNRLDEDKNTSIEGTGLGLAITKSLVEMMGGKIVVQSTYGTGSTFTVYLNQKINKETKQEEKQEEKEMDLNGKKVLLVDDNYMNLKIGSRMLEKYNIQVEEASSGEECLAKIEENDFDIILMDDMMPKMSGTETMKKIKSAGIYINPIVVLTANATSGMRENYITAGFDDYLAKPINKVELEKILKKYL